MPKAQPGGVRLSVRPATATLGGIVSFAGAFFGFLLRYDSTANDHGGRSQFSLGVFSRWSTTTRSVGAFFASSFRPS